VLVLLRQGYTGVIDADPSKYFDTIPHPELMRTIARRIVDAGMLGLIKQWLRAPVETTGVDGGTRTEGGKVNKMGVPRGGVISPLVACLREAASAKAGEPLHEPVPEILAPERQGRSLGCTCHQLRR
jgi:retron-type reverse transcriptase